MNLHWFLPSSCWMTWTMSHSCDMKLESHWRCSPMLHNRFFFSYFKGVIQVHSQHTQGVVKHSPAILPWYLNYPTGSFVCKLMLGCIFSFLTPGRCHGITFFSNYNPCPDIMLQNIVFTLLVSVCYAGVWGFFSMVQADPSIMWRNHNWLKHFLLTSVLNRASTVALNC